MISWEQRSHEERSLLNPAFCANLLWHAAKGYARAGVGGLPFEESFLVLPFVLHRETREALPRTLRTSLAVWLDQNPLARSKVASRARLLIPFTKESLTFAGTRGFIQLDMGAVYAELAWAEAVSHALSASSKEVRVCANRADFVGRWFARTGSATTVLALMGVRP
jgi:hypothetical protein